MERERLAAVGATLLAAALWGTSFPLIKVGLLTINPYSFLSWRFIIAAVILLAIQYRYNRRFTGLINRETAVFGLILSLSFLFQYIGQVTTTAGEAAVLINTGPIIVPVLAYLIIDERLSRKRWPAVAVGVIGILFTSGVIEQNGLSSSISGASELMIGALFTSLYIVVTKKASSTSEPVELFAGSFICAALFVTAFTIISGNMSLSPLTGVLPLLSVLYLSLFCTIFPFFLWFRGLRGLTATASTVITLFEPVVSILISVLLLDEIFTLFALAGTALIFTAIVWMSL